MPDATVAREVEEQLSTPLAEAMRIRDKIENYTAVDRVLEEYLTTLPED